MADQNIMCEVEIQPDIQECVEIESIPVDMPCESVETIVECVGVEPMMSLQSMGNRDDIILQPQEEIIDDSGDPLNVYDEIPVPDSEIYIESSPGPSKKKKNLLKNNRGVLIKRENEMFGLSDLPMETKSRKWEQKQVQIKTMEGEFSVTMWASGTDDGKVLRKTFFFDFRNFKTFQNTLFVAKCYASFLIHYLALWDAPSRSIIGHYGKHYIQTIV